MSTKKLYGPADLEKRIGPMTMGRSLRARRESLEVSQVDFAKLLQMSELYYVTLALRDQLRAAGVKYEVFLKKAS